MVREGEEANNARMAAIDESMDVFRRLAELTIADGDGGEGQEQEDGGHVPGQQIRSRDDEVRNNAGGYVFQVDDLTRVRRFLILGTTGGTYYVGEKELTLQNLEDLIRMIRAGRGGMILREIVEISLAGRSPKQNSLMFALALCARYNVKDRKRKQPSAAAGEDGDAAADELKFDQYMLALHKAALRAVKKVCRIPTHLFMFVKYCELVAKSTLDDAGEPGDAAAADKADQAKEQEKQPDKDGGQQKEEGEKGSTTPKPAAPKPSSSGWGRAMRQCVADWYLQKAPKELAMHLTKYSNREGWTHRDLLRLAHPMASQNGRRQRDEHTLVYDQMFHYACTGEFDDSKANIAIAVEADAPVMKKSRCDYMVTQQMVQCAANSDALELIRRVKEASKLGTDEVGVQRCVELIGQYGLVREHLPTELLNSPPVWIALLQHMPMTALLRNLSKLATIGLLTDGQENTPHVDRVIGKLLSQEALHRARIHPIAVLLASSVYGYGQGIRGKLTWNPNGRVKKALDECFLLAFKNVQPTGKRFCMALDVSGSMSTSIQGGVLSCRQASAAMANVTLRTEQHVECVAFCDKLTPLPFTRDTGMADMVEHIRHMSFGATDCALPMVWAREQRKPFDVFIVYTDNETWSGEVKPFQALRDYRAAMNLPHAKLVVMGMAATEFTIADPTDPGMMDIVGLDASVPELLRAFIMDEI